MQMDSQVMQVISMTERTEITWYKTVASPGNWRLIENCLSSIKALKMCGPQKNKQIKPRCPLLGSAHGLAVHSHFKQWLFLSRFHSTSEIMTFQCQKSLQKESFFFFYNSQSYKREKKNMRLLLVFLYQTSYSRPQDTQE